MSEVRVLSDKEKAELLAQANARIEEVEALLRQGGTIAAAMDRLTAMEKQTRLAGDSGSTTRLVLFILQLCLREKNWTLLNEQIVAISKKRAQLKNTVSEMVREAMSYLDKAPDMPTKLALIDTLRTVTAGKIHVETERARLTRILSKIKEDEGNVKEAAELLQDLQVETYGAMDKREKAEFILEQMRLCLDRADYIRAYIVSKKINVKALAQDDFQDVKLLFNTLMIRYYAHGQEYMQMCKAYHTMYNTKSVQEDETKWKPLLQNVAIFLILSPHDNEQSDLLHRILLDKKLEQIPLYQRFLTNFSTIELINWPVFEKQFMEELRAQEPFRVAKEEDLHKRVVEHNIRVVFQYYTSITSRRFAHLVNLSEEAAEQALSELVVSKAIYAKIDRPAGVITFCRPKDASEHLNEWSGSIAKLLETMENTCHLIQKENMVKQFSKQH